MCQGISLILWGQQEPLHKPRRLFPSASSGRKAGKGPQQPGSKPVLFPAPRGLRASPPVPSSRGTRYRPHDAPPQYLAAFPVQLTIVQVRNSHRCSCGNPGAEHACERERKSRPPRAVRHQPWPLGGRLGAGAAPGAGLGQRWAAAPGPAQPCPRCPEVEMQKSRLSRREVDFFVALFPLTPLLPPRCRPESLGG